MKADKNMHNYLWRTLCDNGWRWDADAENHEDYTTFTLTICVEYEVTVYARVAMNPEHLNLNGHYGVVWLDAEYESPMPLAYSELSEMQYAIEKAEDNLLRNGVPFTGNDFHGRNVANKRRRNDALRKKLNIEEAENKDYVARRSKG